MVLLLLVSSLTAPPMEAPAPLPALQSAQLAAQIADVAIAFAEAEAARLPGTYKIRLLQAPVAPKAVQGQPRIEVSHMSKKEPSGRFFVALKVLHQGRLIGYSRVDLEGTWTGNLLRAKENLPRKAIPEDAQLDPAPFEGLPPAGAITSFPPGFRLRQPVQAGRFITLADLEAIPLVKAGDRIRLSAVFASLTIATDGVARNSAALGERVRVELSGSRKQVQGLVSAEGEARLAGFEPAK